MRSELWLWCAYFAIVLAVIGGIYIRYRQRQARLDEVSERAARLTPRPRTSGDTIDPMRARPLVSTVYWSKEAIKEKIIEEHDASRTTIIQRSGIDREMLKRVWNVARDAGRHERPGTFEDHEPVMSRDLDMNSYRPLRIVTCQPEKPELDGGISAN